MVQRELVELDPSAFRRPRGKGPTRHLYLANCGQARGDTEATVLATLLEVAGEGAEVEGLHIGSDGVSYASFTDSVAAAVVCERLTAAGRWVVKFAGYEDTGIGPPLPSSVASTADVEVEGLLLLQDFVSEAEASVLLAEVDGRPWDCSIKRRVQHYGHAFDYARLGIAKGCGTVELPAFCEGLVRRIAERGVLPHPIDQLTVNEYQPGIGIASHCDAHSAFEDGIAALTLGSGIVMEFRRPQVDGSGKVSVGKHHRLAPPPDENGEVVHKNVWLPANSLLVMRGEARYAWQHGIAWRKTDCQDTGRVCQRGRRVSFTLRTARHRPCDCRWHAMCDAQNPEAHVLPSRLGAAAQAG